MNTLAKLEHKYQQFVEKYGWDGENMLYSCISRRTKKPFVAEDFTPNDSVIDAEGMPPIHVWANYENSQATMTNYLIAQTERYQVTGSDAARALARKVFLGLVRNYEIGGAVERGYVPKPYGGLKNVAQSREMSIDMYAWITYALACYHHIASKDEQSIITHMITDMVDYFVDRDYTHRRYGRITNYLTESPPYMGVFFVFLNKIAYDFTADEKYSMEFTRLVDELGYVRCKTRFDDAKEQQIDEELFVRGTPFDKMIIVLDYLMVHDQQHQEAWRQALGRWLNREVLPTLYQDRAGYFVLYYNGKHDRYTSCEPEYAKDSPYLKWNFVIWRAKMLRPGSPWAEALLRINQHLPDEKLVLKARNILQNMQEEDFVWIGDPDGKQLQPEHKWMSNCLELRAYTGWLAAYWLGRKYEFWG